MNKRLTCKQKDHDGTGLTCGYPLPCPWHTSIVEVKDDAITVTTPHHGNLKARGRLIEVGKAVKR